jgi:hypothetical protein
MIDARYLGDSMACPRGRHDLSQVMRPRVMCVGLARLRDARACPMGSMRVSHVIDARFRMMDARFPHDRRARRAGGPRVTRVVQVTECAAERPMQRDGDSHAWV